MADAEVSVVTGATGFSGKHITRRLLAQGKQVRTLTGHPERSNEFGEAIEVVKFNFEDSEQMKRAFQNASTFYNTYWIRFEHGGKTFDKAVENTRRMIDAARDAGVRRIVHISIIKPSLDSNLPYYRGKAEVEEAIKESGLSYAILRPAILFGQQGILINNIAWFLRNLPVFGIPGDGNYKMQPVFVEDLADLAVEYGASDENVIMDAVGPEVYTFNELVERIRDVIGSRAKLIHIPPKAALYMTSLIGKAIGDIVLTPEEIKGLMENLLVSEHSPTATKSFSEWLSVNADWLGITYFSELKKHY